MTVTPARPQVSGVSTSAGRKELCRLDPNEQSEPGTEPLQLIGDLRTVTVGAANSSAADSLTIDRDTGTERPPELSAVARKRRKRR